MRLRRAASLRAAATVPATRGRAVHLAPVIAIRAPKHAATAFCGAGESCSTCPGDCGTCPCGAGQHLCGTTCVSNAGVSSCGSSCSPCAPPSHSSATCDGAKCSYKCDFGYTDCGGACVDVESDAANCASCGAACQGGGTCQKKLCHGGLFGTCEVDKDCLAGGLCLTNNDWGWPMGTCSLFCTKDAECGASGKCVQSGTLGYCLPSCKHAADCRDGYNCFPPGESDGSKFCRPLCDKDTECGVASHCNQWSGLCQIKPVVDPGYPGALNGHACGVDPTFTLDGNGGYSNCRGYCNPPWLPDAKGNRSSTGYAEGQCYSYCDLPTEYSNANLNYYGAPREGVGRAREGLALVRSGRDSRLW